MWVPFNPPSIPIAFETTQAIRLPANCFSMLKS